MFDKGDLVTVISTRIIGLEEEFPGLYGNVGMVAEIDVDYNSGDVGYVVNMVDSFFSGFIFDENQLRPATTEEITDALVRVLERM